MKRNRYEKEKREKKKARNKLNRRDAIIIWFVV
jgi:hypothetical protein